MSKNRIPIHNKQHVHSDTLWFSVFLSLHYIDIFARKYIMGCGFDDMGGVLLLLTTDKNFHCMYLNPKATSVITNNPVLPIHIQVNRRYLQPSVKGTRKS